MEPYFQDYDRIIAPMSPSDSITFTTETDPKQLILSDITIEDPDVVDYFSENPSSSAVRRVFRVGVQAVRTAETTDDVDYIERRFQTIELNRRLRRN